MTERHFGFPAAPRRSRLYPWRWWIFLCAVSLGAGASIGFWGDLFAASNSWANAKFVSAFKAHDPIPTYLVSAINGTCEFGVDNKLFRFENKYILRGNPIGNQAQIVCWYKKGQPIAINGHGTMIEGLGDGIAYYITEHGKPKDFANLPVKGAKSIADPIHCEHACIFPQP